MVKVVITDERGVMVMVKDTYEDDGVEVNGMGLESGVVLWGFVKFIYQGMMPVIC